MLRDSKYVHSIIFAHDKGYRVTPEGSVIGMSNNILKLNEQQRGGLPYYEFSIRLPGRVHAKVPVHQLQAYQKFGEKALYIEAKVRHLNGDSLDNSEDNIAIGSQSDNMMDRTAEDRLAHAMLASKHITTDEKVLYEINRLYYHENWTNKELTKEFNKAKSTIHEAVNRLYKETPLGENILEIRRTGKRNYKY